MLEHEPLQLRDEPDDDGSAFRVKPWKILIADDEDEVHTVTEMALRHFEFADRPLSFIHARSGAEAVRIMEQDCEIAVVLMDVVMEHEKAGLQAVDEIRNRIGNRFCRIILRTGHPGQAPETEIIARYDIDNYKEKTELTAKKLYTAVYTAIRSYRDLLALYRNRQGLAKVVEACSVLMQQQGAKQFAEGVLEQVAAIMYAGRDSMLIETEGFASACCGKDDGCLVAATGRFAGLDSVRALAERSPEVLQRVQACHGQSEPLVEANYFALCVRTPLGHCMVIYLESDADWSAVDTQVMTLFGRNVAIALDNLMRYEHLNQRQGEMILLMQTMLERYAKAVGEPLDERLSDLSLESIEAFLRSHTLP